MSDRSTWKDQVVPSRYLVRNDHGMSAIWWWIYAESASEITDTLAEVEVVEDADVRRIVESWDIAVFHLTEAASGPLAHLAERRTRHKGDPSYGHLPGKRRVYLMMADPEVYPGEWFSEHDETGRRLRQVEAREDGTFEATTERDWPMNPPLDLGDPQYARHEITQDRFEQVWQQASCDEGT